MPENKEKPPVHESLELIDFETLYHANGWWKAITLCDGYKGKEISVYLWKERDDGRWKRKQKYTIRNKSDWIADRDIINKFVERL